MRIGEDAIKVIPAHSITHKLTDKRRHSRHFLLLKGMCRCLTARKLSKREGMMQEESLCLINEYLT
jgi:hypothetical protein